MNLLSKSALLRSFLFLSVSYCMTGNYVYAQGTATGTITALVETASGDIEEMPLRNIYVDALGIDYTLYSWGLRSSAVAGWTMGSAWEFGTPKGYGATCLDPLSGATGSFVYGNNLLTGNYSGQLLQPSYLTTTAIDCTGKSSIHLRFKRWLGIAGRAENYEDNATVEVSNDGDVWNIVWMNPDAPVCDREWKTVIYDISSVADNQKTVFVRWGIGPTDNVNDLSCGWNIDDIDIISYQNGSQRTVSDQDGKFSVPLPWPTNSIRTSMHGPYCQVGYDYPNTSIEDTIHFVKPVQAGQVVNFVWDDTVYQSLDEINAFWHINNLHDHIKQIDPAFVMMDYPIPVIIGGDTSGWDGITIGFIPGKATPFNVYFTYGLATLDTIYAGLDTSNEPEFPALRNALAAYYAGSLMGQTESDIKHRESDWENNPGMDSVMIAGALYRAGDAIGFDVMDKLVHFARLDRPRNVSQLLESLILKDDQRYGDDNIKNGSPHAEGIYTAFGESGYGGIQYADGSLQIIDEDGDNDGLLEPGESAMVRLDIRNRWADATNIRGELSSQDEFVTVTKPDAFFGNLSYNISQNNFGDMFEITLAADAPADYSLPLSLTLYADGPYSYSRECLLFVTVAENQLFFDDGSYDGYWRRITYSYPMAVSFKPSSYPFVIEKVRIYPQQIGDEEKFKLLVTVWDDNGFDGTPGTILAEKEVEVSGNLLEKWMDIDLTEFHLSIEQGSVYAGWRNRTVGGEQQTLNYANGFDYDPAYYGKTYIFINNTWQRFATLYGSNFSYSNMLVRLQGYLPGLFRLVPTGELYWDVNRPVSHILSTQNAVEPLHGWELSYASGSADPGKDLGVNLFVSGGVAKGWKADDQLWDLNLPFAFTFFEQSYTSVKVCSNGFLNFGPTNTHASNTFDRMVANIRIAPLWDDLRTDVTNGDIFVNDSELNQVTIRWKGITRVGALECNFAVVLFKDGRIRFDYGNGNTGLTPTVGVSAGNQLNYFFFTGYDGQANLGNKNSVLFEPQSVIPSNPLPEGISLNTQDGILSGTPAKPGDYSVRIAVKDSKIPVRTTYRTYKIHVVDRLPDFEQNFENGPGQFQIDNYFGDSNGLWHLTSTCQNPLAGHTAGKSLYYGKDATCNYDSGRTEGIAVTNQFRLLDVQKAYLWFKYYLETEGDPAWDLAAFEISEEGGPFYPIASNQGDGKEVATLIDLGQVNNGYRRCWQSAAVDISRLSGSNIKMRLHFMTGDESNNQFTGFLVDDVVIRYLEPIKGDMVIDNQFDLADLAEISRFWLEEANSSIELGGADLTGDERVDEADLITFVKNYWLKKLPYSGGTGTRSNPYRIATADDLLVLMDAVKSKLDWNKHFRLTGDIDMSGVDAVAFKRIGIGTPFTGSFDGRGWTINGMKKPLFDTLNNAEISDLTLRNAAINDKGAIGVLVCKASNQTTITNCKIAACEISGDTIVGGLAGTADAKVKVYRCSSNGAITGGSSVGGLIGSGSGAFEECYARANVTANGDRAGGFIGNASVSSYFTNCYAISDVVGNGFTGGFAGKADSATFTYCYAASTIKFNMPDSTTAGVFLGGDALKGTAGTCTYLACFWDNSLNFTDPDKTDPMDGIGNIVEPAALMGRTTAQMHNVYTYLNAEWVINTADALWLLPEDDYPILRWNP